MTKADTVDALERLPGATVSEVLEALLRAGWATRSGVEVTLRLRSGRDLSGVLVASKGTSLERAVTLRSGRDSSVTLTYLRSTDIEALTVHRPYQHLELLSFGAVPNPPSGTPVTALAARRQVKDVEERLQNLLGEDLVLEVPWKKMPAQGLALTTLVEAAEEVYRALNALVERYGRDEIAMQVRRVVFAEGPPGVERAAQGLVLALEFEKGRPTHLQGSALEQTLAAIL